MTDHDTSRGDSQASAKGKVAFPGASHHDGIPQYDGTVTVKGPRSTITLRRDRYGIAHVDAADEHDAWFGQGFAAAQDRLWQMEYDRRRATGRWAEVAGSAAVAADVLSLRLQLERAAHGDVDAMSDDTRAMFEAYTAGVNAHLNSSRPLPPEYGLAGLTPERWEPWHSVAVFKVRHALMGTWPGKLAQALLLEKIGPEAFAKLHGADPIGSPVLLPPGGGLSRLYEQSVDDLRAASAFLGFLGEASSGSNSWAVHGSRTTTGLPVLCNDSHRQLDVPNVYWQVHVACPAFNATGATFPGVPGFPHFGHNGTVAWNITHAMGDYQDLYVERFDRESPTRYRTPDGWSAADVRTEVVRVRDGEPVHVELWRTRHGPIVHGDPRTGHAIALRYTAIDAPCRGFEVIRRMLQARSVHELMEAQRGWVDPANNLVCADVQGNIAYVTRGQIPIRTSPAHRRFPVPGWTGEHEWVGTVPFERMPRVVNPPAGYIATANQRIVDGDDPYLGHTYAVPSRSTRLVELLSGDHTLTRDEVSAMQSDTTSVPAKRWASYFASLRPLAGDAEAARQMLASWDGNLLPDSGPALLYSCFRRFIMRSLFEPVVGPDVWAWLVSGDVPGTHGIVEHWLFHTVAGLQKASVTPDGRPLADLLPPVLQSAWRQATDSEGRDPAAWRWGKVHGTNAQHTLAATFPADSAWLNPPRVFLGGDSDTLQRAGYALDPKKPFDLIDTSVYRQVVDLSDIAHASSAIPGGVSGIPGAPHAADQLVLWGRHQRAPMPYHPSDVSAASQHTLWLKAEPAP